ncbi:MAG: FTR1 family protein [bacterium]|nr:FTR1 family protein [bacterium]
MLTTAIIAFREFFEAFLIIGVFLGVSRKLNLKKEAEIGLAALCGIAIALFLVIATYVFGDQARSILTEENADFLEGYLLIFSGAFIAYVVFSLHGAIGKGHRRMISKAQEKLEQSVFDVSLFFTIMFLIVREGFEVALFTASVSLFSAFAQNFLGLLLGFAAASVLGTLTFLAYIRFPVGKIFKVTEYVIVVLGASLTQIGVTKLFETHFNLKLSDMLSFHLQFLPGEDTFAGHLLQGLLGVDQGFSAVRLSIMLAYVAILYFLFMRGRNLSPAKAGS